MPLPPSPAVTITVPVKSASIHSIVITCTVANLDLYINFVSWIRIQLRNAIRIWIQLLTKYSMLKYTRIDEILLNIFMRKFFYFGNILSISGTCHQVLRGMSFLGEISFYYAEFWLRNAIRIWTRLLKKVSCRNILGSAKYYDTVHFYVKFLYFWRHFVNFMNFCEISFILIKT
jgi:hypothetical protein